ncbi:MAG: protein kinase [Blastocatellia bacterium]|jgi:serine/threonine protein kinase|nr:protein kinase [Blastocatellia bacterium]
MDVIAEHTVLQDRYEIVRQLGRGGMGAVYLATDRRFGSTVALKQTLVTGEQLRKAFEREARLLNTLQHAAMPHVIDYFFEGEGQFLVMQFIPGEDLGHMLRSRPGPFEVPNVVLWLDELLDLLDYLHTHEPPIIHRDIKPENLKLTPRGKIILLDFGLAKGLAELGSATQSTASVIGYTPAYASLEQIRGLGTDARSDLYSLAATAYHLLTGQLPADALQRADAFVNGAPDPLRPIEFLNRKIPGRVAEVLHRALALKRDDRPSSARDLRMMLREACGDLLTSALGASAPIGFGLPTGSAGGLPTRPADADTQPATYPVPFSVQPPTVSGDPSLGGAAQAVSSGPGYSVPRTVPTPEPARASGGGLGLAAGIIGGVLFVVLVAASVVGVIGWQKGWFSGGGTVQPPSTGTGTTDQGMKPPPLSTGSETGGLPKTTNTGDGEGKPPPPPPPPVELRLTATASSVRDPIKTNSYSADMAVDGRRDTSWVEGGGGPGFGESIDVKLSSPKALRYIKVCPGFFKSAVTWRNNNRIAGATIVLSDGRRILASFADVETEQFVEVGGGAVTGFRIVIDEVYYGGDNLDTCISEIAVEVQ